MGASEAIAGATERAARAERECDELRTEVARVHADWRGAVKAERERIVTLIRDVADKWPRGSEVRAALLSVASAAEEEQ